LNRTEYQNAIRDILGLDIDVTELLPADEASYGFDNVSVAALSPTLMERRHAAALQPEVLKSKTRGKSVGDGLPPSLEQSGDR
jgi:Protein of unknown function (DUF1587)